MLRSIVILAALLAAAAFAFVPQHPTQTATPTQIQAVGPLQNNGWEIELDNGERLFVEIRVLETGGRAPRPGRIDNFVDQQMVLGLPAGHATFEQGGLTYHAYRPS
ncbi:MAG TPA: hypothetical protein VFS21_40350 [Roseiflexaceae bacterium]|nr:hypothetical protein [Roseiflexaceae bacterium]